MATLPRPTLPSLSARTCESAANDAVAIYVFNAYYSYSVGRLQSLKPLTHQELFMVTPKTIVVQPVKSVAAAPPEKSVPMLPVPPRQDLPPMCAHQLTADPLNRPLMYFQASDFERLLGSVAV
jgi:hypothetical protein